MDLSLQLFGPFAAKDRLGQAINFRDDKVRALLAYLAIEREQAQPREKLLELFWGYAPQDKAQHSLRMALTRLRQSLALAEMDDLLDVNRQTVQLQLSAGRCWVDAVEFDGLVERWREHATKDLTGEWMARAVELYRGGFLAGLSLSNSPSFDNWLMLTHSRYEQQTLGFLDLLTEHALREGQNEPAERYARRQLEITPWLESAQRQLMRVFAQRGQWQLVQQQYQKCVQVLESELGSEPEAETIALLEQLRPAHPGTQTSLAAATPRAIAAAPNNLPPTHTPFFGREAERARLIHALLDDSIALLTIVGPGGSGKTRLSLDGVRHVLHHPAFQDGIWFIALDGLRADDKNLYQAIANTIAKTMGIELRTPGQPHEQLFDMIQERKLLLVLDNFEQLITGESDGVNFVLDLLNRAPQAKLVVSSRRPLNVQVEALIPLDGLPTPQAADERAYTYSSVLLFLERGRRANPCFALDADSLPAVVEICRIMEGMPLGLELVAVRLREMNCQQIVQSLNTNLDLLKSRLRDLPARHRSMRAVFDWSWALLAAEEQRVLADLAVFRGSFTLEAAQAVSGASREPMDALIDHSLVRSDEGRYSLHELLRQFAFEKLEQPEPIQARHSRVYLEFVRARCTRLVGKDLLQATVEIKQEWENVQQAWSWAVNHQDWADFMQTVTSLGRYLRNSGMIWFGEKLFEAAIDSFRAPVQGEAEERLREDEKLLHQQALGHLWLELARCYIWSAQYEACTAAARQAIRFGEAIDSPELVAGGYLEWGWALWRLGKYPAASEMLEKVIRLAPAQSWQAVQAFNTLGNIHSAWGKFDEALSYYQQALQVQKETDIWSNRVQVLNNLATVSAMRGQYEQAIGLLLETLETSRQFDQQYFQITIFHNLGLAHSELGRYTQAEAYFKQALELSRQLQNHHNEPDIWLGLAQLYRRLGQYSESEANLQRAMTLGQQFGEKKVNSEGLMQLALLYYAQGEFAAAGLASQQSVQLIQEVGLSETESDILITRGYCCLALPDYDEAKSAFEAALAALQNIGNPLKELEAQVGLAHVHLKRGERQTASAMLEDAWLRVEQQNNLMGAVLPYDLYGLLAQSLADLDSGQAAELLRKAQALIQTQAQAIPDLAVRQAFLQQTVCARILE